MFLAACGNMVFYSGTRFEWQSWLNRTKFSVPKSKTVIEGFAHLDDFESRMEWSVCAVSEMVPCVYKSHTERHRNCCYWSSLRVFGLLILLFMLPRSWLFSCRQCLMVVRRDLIDHINIIVRKSYERKRPRKCSVFVFLKTRCLFGWEPCCALFMIYESVSMLITEMVDRKVTCKNKTYIYI